MRRGREGGRRKGRKERQKQSKREREREEGRWMEGGREGERGCVCTEYGGSSVSHFI